MDAQRPRLLIGISWLVVLASCGAPDLDHAAPPPPPPVVSLRRPSAVPSKPPAYRDPPPKIDCHLTADSWWAYPHEVHLRVGPTRQPFATAHRGNADLFIRSGTNGVKLAITARGFVLRGAVDPEQLPLYPAKPRLLGGVMVLGPQAELRWRIKGGRVQATHSASVEPHEVLAGSGETLSSVTSPAADWGCDDLALKSAGFNPWDGLQLTDVRWATVSAGTEVELRPEVAGQLHVRLRLGREIFARMVEQAPGKIRVAWRGRTAVFLGWAPGSAVRLTGGRLGRGHRARPPRVRFHSSHRHLVTCHEALDLWVELGGTHHVGYLESGTEVGCTPSTTEGVVIAGPRAEVQLEPGVRLFAKSEDVTRLCTVRPRP